MAIVVKPYTFSAGAVIVASEHNANQDAIFNDYNGNITNANLSASAGIVDTKLAQITTAGKVSGAALALLGSSPSGAGTIPMANSLMPTFRNLIVTHTAAHPTYQLDINATYLFIEDAIHASVDLTVDITASGANGLDTGAEANSTLYAVWAIYNPITDTIAGLLSASFTNPTLPSGYTKKGLISMVRNAASGNFEEFYQYGNIYKYFNGLIVLDNGNSTEWANVACGDYVKSSIASMVHIHWHASTSTNDQYDFYIRTNGATGAGYRLGSNEADVAKQASGYFELPLLGNLIEYNSTDSDVNLDIYVNGATLTI